MNLNLLKLYKQYSRPWVCLKNEKYCQKFGTAMHNFKLMKMYVICEM